MCTSRNTTAHSEHCTSFYMKRNYSTKLTKGSFITFKLQIVISMKNDLIFSKHATGNLPGAKLSHSV